MEDSLLIQTLRLFSKEEMRLFDSFLRNSYFNPGSNANQNIALFQCLSGILDAGQNAPLDRNKILKALSLRVELNEESHYLDNRMSELMSVIRKFIAWQQIEQNWQEAFEYLAMARFYRSRELLDREEQMLHRTRKLIDEFPSDSSERPLLQYWMEMETLHKESACNQRKGDLNTDSAIKSLNDFYGIKLLEITAVVTQQERVAPGFKSEWKLWLTSQRNLFSANDHFGNDTMKLLEHAIRMMESTSGDPFTQLEDFIQDLSNLKHSIPSKVVMELATCARNFCTYQIGLGHIALRNIQIQLYKQHLEMGWLYTNGRLSPTVFINMINCGLNYGEHDWVWHVLETQKDRINSAQHQKITDYGYAQYYFSTGCPVEARKCLNKLLMLGRFKDTSLEKLVRILEIKLLFHEGDDLVKTQLHNFLMFLRRNKHTINQNTQLMHLNFVKVLRQLISLKEKEKFKRTNDSIHLKSIEKLLSRIKQPSYPLADRLWLLTTLKTIGDSEM